MSTNWIDTYYPVGKSVLADNGQGAYVPGTITAHTMGQMNSSQVTGILVRHTDGSTTEYEAAYLDEHGQGGLVVDASTHHPDYGEAAQFSEHRRGDHIAYRQQKDWDKQPEPYSGEILWVCAATEKRGICYIVAPDIETGWIDHVYPGEVLIDK